MAVDPVTFIAGVSGVLQAVQVWYASRNHVQARAAFEKAYSSAQKSLDVSREAKAISETVPQEILDRITERTHRCWSMYNEVLDGHLPAEIDEATEAVKRCICRELKRLIDLGEPLPRGELATWWIKYCRQ